MGSKSLQLSPTRTFNGHRERGYEYQHISGLVLPKPGALAAHPEYTNAIKPWLNHAIHRFGAQFFVGTSNQCSQRDIVPTARHGRFDASGSDQ